VLTGEHTLVVICGASDWPRLTAFEPAAAFTNSATAVREYLAGAGGLAVPTDNLLWLFDATDAVAHYDRIGEFLADRLTSLQSQRGRGMVILVVYVGHGAFFGATREYCLLVRDTRAPIEVDTSLRVATLARLLQNQAPESSRILILDCCFAGEAVHSFQSAIDQTVSAKASEVVHSAGIDRGVALLCASSSRNPARLDSPSSYTLFGRELVRALTTGDPKTAGPMTLRGLCRLVEQGLHETFGSDAPRPEVHVPNQAGGDLAAVPLFPNPASEVEGDLLLQLMEAAADAQSWKRVGALHLAEKVLGSVRPEARDGAREILLGLVADHDLVVARKARDLWHARGLGEIPATIPEHPLRPAAVSSTSYMAGIDFGTTNSSIGLLKDGDVVLVPNREGATHTPSVVSILDGGQVMVGTAAVRQATSNPDYTVRSVKMKLGTDWSIERSGRRYTPTDVAACILRQLAADAERFAGSPIRGAVITVPAYFDRVARHALVDAAHQAEIPLWRIVNEPTAAAMSFGLNRSMEATVAVVDLGGGTFDVTLLEIGEGVVEVKATAGDNRLGGDQWDARLVEHLISLVRDQHRVDLTGDPLAELRLKEAAEAAKIELSSSSATRIYLPYLTSSAAGPIHLHETLSRAEFERITRPILERCHAPLTQVIRDARMSWQDVDHVILVGGASRMPAFGRYMSELTEGREPYRGLIPEGVVNGAALEAGVLGGEVKDVLLLDVVPFALGIETAGAIFTHLVERNTFVPTKKSEIFTTVEDGQEAATIHLAEGNTPSIMEAATLAVVELNNLPPQKAGAPLIEVTIDIDANSIIKVTAKLHGTDLSANVTVSQASVDAARHQLRSASRWLVPVRAEPPEKKAQPPQPS